MSAPTRPKRPERDPKRLQPRERFAAASAMTALSLMFLRQRVFPVLVAAGRGVVNTSAAGLERLAGALRGAALRMAGGLAAAEEVAVPALARCARSVVQTAERFLTAGADGLAAGGSRVLHRVAWAEHRLALRFVAAGTVVVGAVTRIPGRLRRVGAAVGRARQVRRDKVAAGRRSPALPGVLAASGVMTAALVWTVVFAVGVALVGGGLVRTATAAVAVNVEAPDDTVLPALAQRSTIHAADNAMLGVVQDDVYRVIVPLERVPLPVQQAVLAAEDRRFYEHDGYDVEGIGRAMVANFRAGSISQGGSTITQQLAKANFVGDERSLQRKVSELAYAVGLEERLTKDELLERYLNQVYFGAGAYGIAAAAEIYFGVTPRGLRVDQAAMLAGLIRSPGLSPRGDAVLVKQRRDSVLATMGELGMLAPEQVSLYQARPVRVKPREERKIREPYYFEAVKAEFLDSGDPAFNEAFGPPRSDRRAAALRSGGLQITTTLQPQLQAIADEQIEDQFGGREDGRTGAIAAVDPRNGAVVALHGGSDFESSKFNVALQGRRQPGSAMKPFVYAAALEQGLPLSTRLPGGSTTFDVPGSTEPYPVQNFGGAQYGSVDMREALVDSVNTAAVDLFLRVGKDRVLDVASRMGIDVSAAVGPTDGPSIAVGGVRNGITPLEMASAYGAFANGGQHVRPHLIDRVLGPRGEVRYTEATKPVQALDPRVNAAMVDIMGDVVTRGTGTAANLPDWSEAGKSGTTQDAKDAWFVGYTPVLSTAVWMGHVDPEPMSGATGGGVPASLWNDFMSPALEDVEPVAFPDVDYGEGRELAVPDVEDLPLAQAEEILAGAGLGGRPIDQASSQPRGTVIWQTPDSGETIRSSRPVTLGVSSGREPTSGRRPSISRGGSAAAFSAGGDTATSSGGGGGGDSSGGDGDGDGGGGRRRRGGGGGDGDGGGGD